MNEGQVSLLIKAASLLSKSHSDPAKNVLRSYYLMRCREISKDHGLPAKHFSSKVRCSKCFIEWNKDTETKVRLIKLSKRQKRRIKQYKINNNNQDHVKNKKELLISNELEQICTFCKNSTVTNIHKPTKLKVKEQPIEKNTIIAQQRTQTITKKDNKNQKVPIKKVEVDVYSKTKDVFSLSNKNNILQGVVKEQKVIKNNKKKKDKFAGLCQQAVLASAKLKQEKEKQQLKKETEKQNRLNLFLKPSS